MNKAVKAVIAKEKPKVSSKKPKFIVKLGIPNFIASKKNFFTCPSGKRPERYREKALPKTPPTKIKIIRKGTVFFCILPPL
jgi:hypothetical protein